ncbi:MAG: hypothetical protein BMS9Abin01_0378 [Gammaproteobacteria bacterium]|nr:MAG: hypothetical protein BMS9Abin01_0378 [Gammaproteobacteria bacterium]
MRVATYILLKCSILVAALTLGSQIALAADDSSGTRVVDGVIITYAVIPAELIRQAYRGGEPESVMHGGVPGGEHHHHVMVALFRVGSNERITDAVVHATTGEVGLSQKTKDLKPMPIAGQMTYGNYFHMPRDQLYRISLEIRVPGLGTVETRIDYQHHL